MKMRLMGLTAAAAMIAASPVYAKPVQELRIGFLTTYSGGGAVLGKKLDEGFRIGLMHEGWTKDGDKLGGIPMKLLTGDDQFKPDVGRTVVDKWLKSDRVHIVAGIVWSNVLMAVARPIERAKRAMVITNAGASPLAGRNCSPYFLSTSWNNDQQPEAMGKLMTDEKVDGVYLLAPNYQAGKDMLSGFGRYYKGKVAGRLLYKTGQKDFQAEISKIRAAKPSAVFTFSPGGMGIAFLKQWAASGVGKDIKLYTVFTVDYATLPAIGPAAIGTYHTSFWSPDSDNAVNQKFVKDYMAKYSRMPSQYAAQSYDAARVIAAGVKKLGGKLDDGDMLPLAKAMRDVSFPSIRGDFKYNVNGIPVQNFYKREVVAGPDGKPMIKTASVVFKDHKDSYWEKCPKARRH